MTRHGDKWPVPATMILGLEPSPKFIEPSAEERDGLLKMAKAWSTAAKSVLEGLKKTQYKNAAEAEAALKGEFAKTMGT
jgi:hypothetical protein